MALDNVIAYLTPRGGQLPTGEESRLLRLATGGSADRFAITYADGVDSYAVWTIPYWPDIYSGTGTLKAVFHYMMDAGTTGNVAPAISVEAVTPLDAVNLNTTNSFDTETISPVGAVAGTAGYMATLTVTLSNKDSVAVGDYVRIKAGRNGTNVLDTATGVMRLLGITILETVTDLNTSGATTNTVNLVRAADGSTTTPAYSFTSDTNTGLRWVSADKVALVTGGADRITIGATAFDVTASLAGVLRHSFTNTSNSASAYCAIDFGNDIGTSTAEFLLTSSNNTTYAGASGFAIVCANDTIFHQGGSERMRWKSSGDVLIGTSTAPTGTIGKTLFFGANGGNPTPGALTAGIYAKTGANTEMWVIDSAGNATQISRHASIDLAINAGIRINPKDPYPQISREQQLFLGVEAFTYVDPETGLTQRVIVDLPKDQTLDWEKVQDQYEEYANKALREWEAANQTHEALRSKRTEKYNEESIKWSQLDEVGRSFVPRPTLEPDREMSHKLPKPSPHVREVCPSWISDRLKNK